MWGEISNETPEPENPIDLTAVMEQSRDKDCLSMYNIPSFEIETRKIKIPPMDSRMLFAGELHNCVAQVQDVMEEAELAVEYNVKMQTEMPVLNDIEDLQIDKIPKKMDNKPSDFILGIGKEPPRLTNIIRRKIERKCIATLLCQIGLLETSSTCLDVLIDIFETFMRNLCKDLKYTNDAHLLGEDIGFSDVVDKVLVQNGLGGIQGVCDYYEQRVIKYDEVIRERYKNVINRYDSLLNSISSQVKTEKSEEIDNEDVPEVHLTAMDGEEGYLQPFLESGFQMLNTLEEGQL